MSNFNDLERGWEAAQWNRYEAELNRPDPPEPTMIQRRQALMAAYCKLQGWPPIVAKSNQNWLENVVSQGRIVSPGLSFSAALGQTVDKLPRPTHRYTITPRGHGVWNLTHRKGNAHVH